MDANIQGALKQINKCWRLFEHNGLSMTKRQVKAMLDFGIKKGYISTSEIKDYDVDTIINTIKLKSESKHNNYMKKKLIEIPTPLFTKIEVLAKQNDRSVNKQITIMLKEASK